MDGLADVVAAPQIPGPAFKSPPAAVRITTLRFWKKKKKKKKRKRRKKEGEGKKKKGAPTLLFDCVATPCRLLNRKKRKRKDGGEGEGKK